MDVTRQGSILLGLALKDGLGELGLVSPRAVCPDCLVVACGEAALDLHRHPLAKLDDIRSGAVVGHEHNALRVVTVDELVDALDGRALETHDCLVVITYRHDVGSLEPLAEELDDPHLGTIGILELVNLDVGIGVLELLAQIAVLLDRLNEVGDHVVVVVEMLVVEGFLVALGNRASSKKTLAFLSGTEVPPLLVASLEERVSNARVTRGLSVLVHELGAPDGVAQARDKGHVDSGGGNHGALELVRGMPAGALDLRLKALRNACARRHGCNVAKRGVLLKPVRGMDALLGNLGKCLIGDAAALDL